MEDQIISWPHQQLVISGESERRSLLSRMVRFEDQEGVPAWKWERRFYEWTIVLPSRWFLIRLPKPIPRQYADYWSSDQGEWAHGSRRGAHEELGMSFAWWATENTVLENVSLADSPDVSARFLGRRVEGDIGCCSPWAFTTGLRCLGFHSLWISVLDASTQVLVEFRYGIGAFLAYSLGYGITRGYSSQAERDSAIRAAFWCPEHTEWVLPQQARNNFWTTQRTMIAPPPLAISAMSLGGKRRMRRRRPMLS
jgi:hypothetical protein